MHMLRFQRQTLYFTTAAYLLAASLGMGGWRLCIHDDGQLLLSPKYVHAHGCKSRHLLCHSPEFNQAVDSRPVSTSTCGAWTVLSSSSLGHDSYREDVLPHSWPVARHT